MGHDTIRLTGIQLHGRHGVFDQEKQGVQTFVVDAELQFDLRSPGASDNITDTISYAEVADIIEDVIAGPSRDLIETLAETIAHTVLHHDTRIEAAVITVHKPQAPMTQTFDDVSVTVRRSRSDVRKTPALGRPRQQVTSYYQGELVDERTEPSQSEETEESEHRVTTPTAALGYYNRTSLTELGNAEQTADLRDPDLPASFPVRSVLALGSNLGTPQATLDSAIRTLGDTQGVAVINVSPLARTKPVGGPENQPDFFNQVIEIETTLSPHQLLDLGQQTETEHNRVRKQHWGPRTLDIDIITYASARIDSSRLHIPHPRAAERAFVLLPWTWMDPIAILDGQPVRELAQQADDYAEVVRLDAPPYETES